MNDSDDRDLLAAEYVLGTLDAVERDRVAASLGDDPDLARAVGDWEDRLSPLVARVAEVPPPEGSYERIALRLFGRAAAPVSDGAVATLRGRVNRWRFATGGFAAMAAALLAWIVVRPAIEPPPVRFTAVLQRDAGAPAMVVDVDLAARRLIVRALAPAAPSGHDYELWIIDPALGAPRSLGLVFRGGGARSLSPSLDTAAIAGATYAVTLEPTGGAPDGRPTTSPILSGKLQPSPS